MLIVFGLWILASAMIFIVVVLLHKRDPGGHMKATSPVMLTLLSVIVGLNWLRVSMGVGGGCYSGIEMMQNRSQVRCIS